MQNIMKKTAAGAVMGGALLFTGMGVAQAAPLQLQDGLVNVAVGDVTVLRNVQVEAVAQVLANVCPNVNAEDINVLATQVDRDGGTQQVATCTAFTQPVNLQQNGPGNGNAANAPGQNR
jgi:hypothetical protein